MKIISWNIFNGGQDGPDASVAPKSRRELTRLDGILNRLVEEQADVIVLQEANFFDVDEHWRLREFENVLQMRGYLAHAASGYHVAVFVNPEWDARISHVVGPWHASANLLFRGSRGQKLEIIGHHLLPFDRDSRVEAVESLRNKVTAPHPVLIIGDFNGVESSGDVTSAVLQLPAGKRERHVFGDGRIDTRAIDAMYAAGWVDVCAHFGAAIPTVPTSLKTVEDEFASLRLDYAFANRALAPYLTDARVLGDDGTAYLSDHYPLCVSIESVLGVNPRSIDVSHEL